MRICFILILSMTGVLMTACGGADQAADNSPGGALKEYVAASQKQDIAAMKRRLSRASLEMIEKGAKARSQTVDDVLRRESEVKIKNAPEIRNEKIEGETATVEVKNETTGQFDMTLPLVREDGAWKIARDKYIEQLKKNQTK